MSAMPPALILASASPRRRELLAGLGLDFEVQPAAIDECPGAGEPAADYVLRMAREKAQAIAGSAPDRIVLGSDTAVVVDGQPLGKPADFAEARQMLTALSGREHEVLSAVALVGPGGEDSVLSRSRVRMRELTTTEITAYWETGEPADKAGAYAIQGLGGIFVSHLSGSYSGVMGLPVHETAELLARAGIRIL